MFKISLIIPTYNRAAYLEQALSSFLIQTLAPHEYEILIIDNHSTDDTRETVMRLMASAKSSWNYYLELRQGLHNARNKGILKAKGDIIVFVDDDAIADRKWLEEIYQEFKTNPQTGIAGGKISPIWGTKPEDWIYDYGTVDIHPVFAYLNYGEDRVVLTKQHDIVYGCNFAIRRDLAVQIGGSYPDTYPTELKHLSGPGEYGMICDVRKLGYDVVYLPHALVQHHVDPSRITLNYFIDRYERWANEFVFTTFREELKREAATTIINTAIDILENVKINSQNKVNPDYYEIIMKKLAYQKIKQMTRVLTDQSLYYHIMKKNSF